MPIEGIFFENQYLTAKGLGAFGDASLSDGILTGCSMTVSSNSVTVTEGYAIIRGRVFYIPQTTLNIQTGTSSTAYTAIIATVDTTAASEEGTFSQVTLRTLQGSSVASVIGGLTNLDINLTGSMAEAVLAILNTGTSLGVAARNVSSGRSMTTIWTNPSPAQGFSAQTVNCPAVCFYDTFYIEIRRTSGNDGWDGRNGTILHVPAGSSTDARPAVVGSWNSRVDITYRNVTINRSTGQIVFGDGTSSGANYSTDTKTTYAVPVAIYGMSTH